MTTDTVIELNEQNFEEIVLKADLPVLVDFWAEWCGPCKMFAPTFEEAAKEYAGKVVFAKLNVDHGADLAAKYNIRSIPTLISFSKGEPKEVQVGALAKNQLKDFIGQQLQ